MFYYWKISVNTTFWGTNHRQISFSCNGTSIGNRNSRTCIHYSLSDVSAVTNDTTFKHLSTHLFQFGFLIEIQLRLHTLQLIS